MGRGRRLQSTWREQLPRERCHSLSWRPDPSRRQTFVVGAGRVSSGVARALRVGGRRGQKQAGETVRSQNSRALWALLGGYTRAS